MAPIRMINLIDVRVGHELVRVGNHSRPYRLVIAATETKNTEPIEFELPAELSDMIDLYLRDHHPLLTRPGNRYLFPAAAGGHKAQGTLSQQLQGLLYTHLGFKMTPHQFRHLSAWLYLRRRPGDFVTVQKLLGHKNIKTTMNFYAGLDTTTAARHYDALIAEERDPDETPPRPRRRRS
jgi:integrase